MTSDDDFLTNRHSIRCEVCREDHPTYMCCDKCNYDTHTCPGCGDPLGHGQDVCFDCMEDYE